MGRMFVVCVMFVSVALVAGVIATAIDYWRYSSADNAHGCRVVSYDGLWERCSKTQCSGGPDVHICVQYTKDIYPEDHISIFRALQACRGLMITGVILIGLSIPLFIKLLSKKTAAFCLVIGGICCIAAAITYGVKFYGPLTEEDKKFTHLHTGFALAVIAGLLSFIDAAIMVKSGDNTGYYAF